MEKDDDKTNDKTRSSDSPGTREIHHHHYADKGATEKGGTSIDEEKLGAAIAKSLLAAAKDEELDLEPTKAIESTATNGADTNGDGGSDNDLPAAKPMTVIGFVKKGFNDLLTGKW